MKKKYVPLLLIFYFLPCLSPVIAGDKPFTIIDLKDGINYIDINKDGKNDMVVRSWWENNNAHGYYKYTFHIHESDDDIRKEKANKQLDDLGKDELAGWEMRAPSNQINEWLIVAFEHEDGTQTDSLETTNGADCVLKDIYLLKDRDDKFEVIIAKRPFKESFYEKLKVTFYRYEFIKDEEGLMGFPPFRFVYKDKTTTRNSYCDANEAFEKEFELLFKSPKRPSKQRGK